MEAIVESESAKRQVTLTTVAAPGGLIEITVDDTGPGLSAQAQAKLFEPFFTTKKDGLGMGLAIARSIVRGIEGKLLVERNSQGGARFIVQIPVDASSQS